MSSFVKDNGGLLAVVGVIAVMLMGYVEWRVSVNVSKQLTDAGVVKTAAVTVLRDDIDENTDDIDDITDRWNRLVDAVASQ